MKRQSAECYKDRLEALRNEMNTAGVDVLYIPCGDFHMSEYISDHFKCREYISGFDGSGPTEDISCRPDSSLKEPALSL